MSRSWVPGLLRARQLQEDVARERLAHARRHAHSAEQDALAEDLRLAGMSDDGAANSTLAFVAAAAARQAAAATWAAARQAQAMADDQVQAKAVAVSIAARQRRGAEKLAERDAERERIRTASALQHELDDIGARIAAQPERGTG